MRSPDPDATRIRARPGRIRRSERVDERPGVQRQAAPPPRARIAEPVRRERVGVLVQDERRHERDAAGQGAANFRSSTGAQSPYQPYTSGGGSTGSSPRVIAAGDPRRCTPRASVARRERAPAPSSCPASSAVADLGPEHDTDRRVDRVALLPAARPEIAARASERLGVDRGEAALALGRRSGRRPGRAAGPPSGRRPPAGRRPGASTIRRNASTRLPPVERGRGPGSPLAPSPTPEQPAEGLAGEHHHGVAQAALHLAAEELDAPRRRRARCRSRRRAAATCR